MGCPGGLWCQEKEANCHRDSRQGIARFRAPTHLAEQNGTLVWASAHINCATLGRSLNLSELTFLVCIKSGFFENEKVIHCLA